MKKHYLLAGVALCWGCPGLAQADDPAADEQAGLGEIVVTAGKREQLAQETPLSIQVLDGDFLQEIGAVSVNDYLDKVPGLTNFGNGTTRNNFTIRGIANIAGSFPAVGYYLDEAPISDIGAPSIDLFDIERLEVLKGPQGTLFGEGSIGGLIRVITAKPDTSELSGRMSAGISSIRRGSPIYRVAAALNLPVSETFAVRASASYTDDGGFIDNRTTGTEDVNFARTLSLRLAAAWRPTERLEIVPSIIYQRIRQGTDSFNNPTGADPVFANPGAGDFTLVNAAPNNGDLTLVDNARIPSGTDLTLANAFDGFSNARFYLPSLTATYSADSFDIVSATSFYDFKRNDLSDDRATAASFRSGLDQLTDFGVLPIRVPFPSGFPLAGRSEIQTFTQELRLVSTGSGPLQWVVGAFYRDRDTESEIVETAPDLTPLFGVGNIFETRNAIRYRQLAVFGEATYAVTDRLNITGGIRVFREKIDATSQSGTFVPGGPPTFAPGYILFPQIGPTSSTENDAVFKAAVDYKLADNAMLYALFSQGFRTGGINTRIIPPGGDPALPDGSPVFFGSEKLDNYEVGIKSTLADGRLVVNLAGFILETTDPQLPVEIIPGFTSTVNAAGGLSRSKGFEGEVQFRPIDALTVGGSFAYTDATLVSVGTNGTLVAGSIIPNTPEFKSTVYAEGEFPVGPDIMIRPRIDYDYTGSRFVGPSLDPAVAARPPFPAYEIVNLQVGVEFKDFVLTGFVTNVGDTRAVLSNPSFTQLFGLIVNRPRTIGVRLDASF
jgi:outer membrane receptor protein involved in Fe transport